MATSRPLLYKALIFPNYVVEFLLKALTYVRFAYCKIVWAGPNELFYDKPQHVERLLWLAENVRGKTIEVGCSTGYITGKLNLDVGLDLDRKRLQRAKWFRDDHNFVCSDGSRLPFGENQFDTVILSEVLEHIPFLLAKEFVSEACRVGKYILITIPKLPKYLENPEHIWIPTTKEKLQELLGPRKYEAICSPDEDYFWVKLFPESYRGQTPQSFDLA